MVFQSDLSVRSKSDALKGCRIALCITGSIAAVETVKLVRELRRHGAVVRVSMTAAAETFITPLSLQWASTHPVVTGLSGEAEHIVDADLVLVAPATMNTINKVHFGIADDVVSTLLASAWGKKLPIVIVPSMHQSLSQHPRFKESFEALRKELNFCFVTPKNEEGKDKFPDIETVVAIVSHEVNRRRHPLSEKKILITAGPTHGPIDPVRFLSNASSGALGTQLAKELYCRGADPTLIYGPGKSDPHSFYGVVRVKTLEEMLAATILALKEKKFNAAIFAAAVLDHVPHPIANKKLSSQEPLQIQCRQTPKIIEAVDQLGSLYKVGFKLLWNASEVEMEKAGVIALERMRAQVVVVNDLAAIEDGQHPAWVMDRKQRVDKVTSKKEIIEMLIQRLADDL